ncbi:MAG: tetratricopeptide repeat protein [Bacteroidota bacterium]
MRYWTTIILALLTICSFGQTKDKYDKIVDSLSRAGQSEKLIPYFQKELKSYPINENVLRWLGYLFIADNQLDLGEKYYNDALIVNPKCARCYMNIGRVYALKKDDKKAFEFFDKSINTDPNDAMLYSTRANLKEIKGDKFGALFDFNKAIELDPKNADYYIQRGLYNSNQGFFSLAISDLNKAVELAPNNYYPYFQRSSLYYGKQMVKEALEDINKALQLDSTQQVLYTGRGAIYAFLKEHEKAIADYTKAIQLNPKDYLPYYNRALDKYALEDMNGSCSDLHECFSVLQKYEPDNSLIAELEYSIGNYCDSTKASYYYQRGIAFYNLQQFDQAVNIYSVGIMKFPDNSMILSFRGNAYFALKNYTKALPDYCASIKNKENVIYDIEANQKHLKLTNESIDTYINGFIASMQICIAESKFALGQYDEALIEINKGIEITPNIKEFGKENYYNVRGNIYLAIGKYQQAIIDFDKCIQINSSFPLAYVNRAVAKINLANNISITSYSIRGGINNQTFNVNWTLPLKTSVKKTDNNINWVSPLLI